MHALPRYRGKWLPRGAPKPENFQNCPAPPRKCPKFNCYHAPPRGFSPCPPRPTPNNFSSAPPRPEAKKGCPVHPCTESLRCMKYFQHNSVLPAVWHALALSVKTRKMVRKVQIAKDQKITSAGIILLRIG